jgi:uncharacterized coiled-coil protein SlyX
MITSMTPNPHREAGSLRATMTNETLVRLNARIANQREEIAHLHFVVRELRKKLAKLEGAIT